MSLNREQIAAILADGNFCEFVGELENAAFDGKGQPYPVDTDAGKRELAKDVSAFANASGGYVIIGLRTKPSNLHYADEVEEVRSLPQGLINTLQLRDIVNAWVYPAIENLVVNFCGASADQTRGLVAIEVPQQRDELKPFLITRSFDGNRHVETMFGYVERKADVNSPLGIADLQRALRSGLHFEKQVTPRLDRIEAILAARVTPATTEPNVDSALRLLDERIRNAVHGGSRGPGT